MMFSRSISILLLLGLTTACAALDVFAAPSAPLNATETPPASATIDWFPASATPTPQVFSTQTPTPEMRPGLGTLALTDDFSIANLWNISTSDQGSAAIDSKRLTLAVQPHIYMISLRNDLVLGDFYAEIIAQPDLCRGRDEYGILIRANAVAYYRFALNCNGQVRAERVSVNQKHPLQSPVSSVDAPISTPGQVRIGIWASGSQMRFFLNDHYQFGINDANYASGTIGVFAYSISDTPVTINFSDLAVRKLNASPAPGTTAP
jgi:hypothetical protein